MKHESPRDEGAADSEAPITTQVVTTRSGRASKTATPMLASFPEVPMARSRSTRNNNSSEPLPSKRAKKGAALAARARAANSPSSPAQSSEVEIEGDEALDDEEEPRYCYCNQVSYGEMVGCDNDDCQWEWFHLSCVGLTKAPEKKGMSGRVFSWNDIDKAAAKWYCPECRKRLGRQPSRD